MRKCQRPAFRICGQVAGAVPPTSTVTAADPAVSVRDARPDGQVPESVEEETQSDLLLSNHDCFIVQGRRAGEKPRGQSADTFARSADVGPGDSQRPFRGLFPCPYSLASRPRHPCVLVSSHMSEPTLSRCHSERASERGSGQEEGSLPSKGRWQNLYEAFRSAGRTAPNWQVR